MIINGIETSLNFDVTEYNKLKLRGPNCEIEMSWSDAREVFDVIMEQIHYLKLKRIAESKKKSDGRE